AAEESGVVYDIDDETAAFSGNFRHFSWLWTTGIDSRTDNPNGFEGYIKVTVGANTGDSDVYNVGQKWTGKSHLKVRNKSDNRLVDVFAMADWPFFTAPNITAEGDMHDENLDPGFPDEYERDVSPPHSWKCDSVSLQPNEIGVVNRARLWDTSTEEARYTWGVRVERKVSCVAPDPADCVDDQDVGELTASYTAESASSTYAFLDDANGCRRVITQQVGAALEQVWMSAAAITKGMDTFNLVSKNASEEPGDANSWNGAISTDGNRGLFMSMAQNLLTGPTISATTSEVYIFDVDGATGNTSIDRIFSESDERDSNPVISGNGQVVAADRTDGNLYLLDLDATPDGEPSVLAIGAKPSLSDSGRYVAFESDDNYFVLDNNFATDIFVADLDPDEDGVLDISSSAVTRVSVATDGSETDYDLDSTSPVISGNGRCVVFSSDSTNLGATTPQWQLFLHDRDADEDGFYDEADGIATFPISVSSAGIEGDSTSVDPTISNDCRYVVFQSYAANLVSEPTTQGQIYVHSVFTGETALVSKNSSGAAGDSYSTEGVISPGGSTVSFRSEATNFTAEADDLIYITPNPLYVAE
ncbi:MAG: hypothetical protein GY854_05260, partial [Deltaproteobacteria bacterium]|nr:hypothetical protein [Deltaproteobacteria bacterium]